MPSSPRYWFPAKRYGWGWGLPTCWQGWLVYAVYALLVGMAVACFPPHTRPGAFIGSQLTLCALLLAICWRKGEPPRWRWGDD
ncbi:hypothetical protein BKK79_03885 [Cupriavidus sp. USMAA2-4]|uniref:Uncharacterized protein n=1 Tax=Cupriavidus malaysiensis TaxID=367825 RepID=A0ABN4TM29_9BURK|nr:MULTISPECIES: hypothetical protein [Cupriavidus]AOY91049.1 hypothetical protein BKK79_03885 [Cupriavidus sp. USMAA2-4]AOY99376.1 hypothetical protein BKK81_08945 [Cupriavidus sp. USMAHM13]AOZ05993.1 hypothetical protein BKK80_09230 [Cupriavidus malaysiensis]